MERANKICRILSLIPGEGSTHAFLKIRGDVGGFDWKAVCALEELVARQKWMRTKGKSEADREWLRSFYNGELQY